MANSWKGFLRWNMTTRTANGSRRKPRRILSGNSPRKAPSRLPDPGPLSSRDARINSGQMKQHTEMKMKTLQSFAFFVMIALVPTIAIAQSASGISAKVEKVDESANKVTLDHAAIPGLDMPAMTMVYKVQDPKVLKSVKSGDKVKFNIERINGQLTVTKIDKAK